MYILCFRAPAILATTAEVCIPSTQGGKAEKPRPTEFRKIPDAHRVFYAASVGNGRRHELRGMSDFVQLCSSFDWFSWRGRSWSKKDRNSKEK